MKKRLFSILFPFFLVLMFSGCGSLSEKASNLQLVFSSSYHLDLPVSFFQNTKIAKASDIILKFDDEAYVSFGIITRDLEGLDTSFDLLLYPEFILGVKAPHSVSEQSKKKFIASYNVYKYRLGGFHIEKKELNGVYIFLAKGDNQSVAFVVNKIEPSQVLVIDFNAVSDSRMETILKGLRHNAD